MALNRFEKIFRFIPNELWSMIARIDEMKGQWIGGASLSPQVLGRLKRSVLITSTGASTRIEGAKLSDEVIEKMMRGISIQAFADRDRQEVKGYYELLEKIFDGWKHITFSENTIKHFHQELLKYVGKDTRHRGEYKNLENTVEMFDARGKSVGVVFQTTPAYLTPKEMQELVEWTQMALKEKKYHPLLMIGHFVVAFLSIHPFVDGNGRLSRILTNLLLLQAGYEYIPYVSHEKLVEHHKVGYYLALRNTQKTLRTQKPDLTSWLRFFLSLVLEQSKMALTFLSKENFENILSTKQLLVWDYLQTVDEATPQEIVKKTRVVRPTVKQALDKLFHLEKVQRIGMGRATRYRIRTL